MKKTPGSTKPFDGSCADLNWSVTEYWHESTDAPDAYLYVVGTTFTKY